MLTVQEGANLKEIVKRLSPEVNDQEGSTKHGNKVVYKY